MILVPRRRGLAWADYAPAPPAGDPYWSNVVSLVRWEDDATGPATNTGPFIDRASGGVWTRQGTGPQTSAVYYKYGAKGFLTGTYGVSQPDHADWDMGSGDFTIEVWFYLASLNNGFGNPNQITNKGWVFGQYCPFYLTVLTTGVPQFLASTTGTSWDVVLSGGGPCSTLTWYHLAVTRNGNVYRLYLDGTEVATTTVSGALMTNTNPLMIGNEYGTGIFYGGNLYLDEYRLTKGVARYTSNFTPPSGAFPVGAAGIALDPTEKGSGVFLDNDNLTATRRTGSGVGGMVRGTVSKSSGKWYTEFRVGYSTISQMAFGLMLSSLSGTASDYIGGQTSSWGYWSDGSRYYNGVATSGHSSYTAGDVIGMAWDADAGKLWWSKNNVWQGSGDPAAGTNAGYTGVTGTAYPGIDVYGNALFATIREASSHDYAPPSGFSAW